MNGFLKKCLRYLHPLNKIHIRISFELYQPLQVKALPLVTPVLPADVSRLVDKGKKASAAKLSVIGLEKLQAHYGANWEKIAEKVHLIIGLILKKHLAEMDEFVAVKGNAYILLFGNADEKQAQEKCEKISVDIYATFLKDKMLASLGLSLTTAVAEVDPKTKKLAELGDILDQKARKSLEVRDFPDMTVATAPKLENHFDSTGKAILPSGLEIHFRPLLDVQTRAVTGFSCVPYYDPGVPLEGYDVLMHDQRDNTDLLAQIDQLALSRVRLQIMALAKKGRKAVFICPVHYKTLSDIPRSAVYLQFCAALGLDERQSLMFEIVGIPKSLDQPGVKGAIALVRPHGKAVMARTQIERQTKSNLTGVGIDILSVDIRADVGFEAVLVPKMKTFMIGIKEDKMKAFATGLSNVYLARAAAGAGFSAVGGAAIWPLVKEADPDIQIDTSTFMQAEAG